MRHSRSATLSCSHDSSRSYTTIIRICCQAVLKATRSLHLSVSEKATRRRSSPTLPTYASVSNVPMNTSRNSCLLSWAQAVAWTDHDDWSSEVVSSKSKSRMCCEDISVCRDDLHFRHSANRSVVEYVTCKTCRSPDTELSKGENRLYFVSCNSCQSRRSVTAIKVGFTAQVGKRKRQQV